MVRSSLSLLLVLLCATGASAMSGGNERVPPENDTCDRAIEIWSGGGCSFSFDGTTVGATNDYDPFDPTGGESCLERSALGPDVVYKAYLGGCGGGLLYVVLTIEGSWDAVMYLVSDCDDPAASCLAAAGPEEPIEFYAPFEGWYYLIIDSYSGAGQFHGYHFAGVIGSWATGAESGSWSRLKSLYR